MSNRLTLTLATVRTRLRDELAKPRNANVSFGGNRFSLKERIFFAKRLSFLVKAGVPLIECLSIMRTQTKVPAKIKVMDALIADIANGQYLATSLSKHKRFFDDFSVSIIRVGESSGILTQNLAYLAAELEKKGALRRKITNALVYPTFITITTLGVTGMLTVFIFPKILPIFEGLGAKLPPTTRALLAVSNYLRAWGILTIVGIVVLIAAIFFIRAKYPQVRLFFDRSLLRIPLAGSIARSYNLANFCRTLGLMLRSGVPITAAMTTTANATINRAYRGAYEVVSERIASGDTISQSLAATPALFPDLLTHMIAVGEKTGNLPETLLYVSELYEAEVDDLTKNLSSAIEPAIMIFMGILVGLIAVSVITPIYEITQHLSPR